MDITNVVTKSVILFSLGAVHRLSLVIFVLLNCLLPCQFLLF